MSSITGLRSTFIRAALRLPKKACLALCEIDSPPQISDPRQARSESVSHRGNGYCGSTKDGNGELSYRLRHRREWRSCVQHIRRSQLKGIAWPTLQLREGRWGANEK